jgi:hypothetical protein
VHFNDDSHEIQFFGLSDDQRDKNFRKMRVPINEALLQFMKVVRCMRTALSSLFLSRPKLLWTFAVCENHRGLSCASSAAEKRSTEPPLFVELLHWPVTAVVIVYSCSDPTGSEEVPVPPSIAEYFFAENKRTDLHPADALEAPSGRRHAINDRPRQSPRFVTDRRGTQV